MSVEWVTTEPADAGTWEQEATGSSISYSDQVYFSFRSTCAVTRLKDGRVCVRIQVETVTRSGYSYKQQASVGAVVNDGSGDSKSGTVKISVGSSWGVRGTWYAILDNLEVGTSITAGGGAVDKRTSKVTLTAPALLGNTVFVNIGGAWKQGTMFVNVSGVWKQCFPKVNIGGVWK